MAKKLKTKDKTLIREIKEIQDDLGGATINGQPRPGVKKNPDGTYTPITVPYGHPKWVGTVEVHSITLDEDGETEELELIDDVVEKIEKVKSKPDHEKDDKEKKLSKVKSKDIVDTNVKVKPSPQNLN